MKKKIIILLIAIVVIIVGLICFFFIGINWLLSEQYNEKGISHFLVITTDKNQPREYVGELEGHRIFIENLNLEETNFRTVNAENISIKEAIENNLVSIKEWKKYAWKIKKMETQKFYNLRIMKLLLPMMTVL